MARGERCPICNAEVRPRPENLDHPFCTARCKTIDLGRWLNEEYRIPLDDELDEDDDGSSDDSSKTSEDVRH